MNNIYRTLGIEDATLAFGEEILRNLKERFDEIDKVAEYNQLKVIKAMQEAQEGRLYQFRLLYERLRSKVSDTPIIFVTAKGELQDRLQGLELGAEDYIVKPFVLQEKNCIFFAKAREKNLVCLCNLNINI